MIKPLHLIGEDEIKDFGGKAVSLSRLIALGYRVPRGFALSTSFYLDFIKGTSLEHSLNLELRGRDMENMRWEELWDTSLRIRSLFLSTPIPDSLTTVILPVLSEVGYPLVVRSSAPEEDSGNSSFAGLHESVVDISTPQKAVDAVRIVWASLWSDSSLLYRKELGLQAETSSMGVVVQEMIRGDVSGVAFTRNPADDSDHFVIEAVEGLNEKLVSGGSDPFRLIIEKCGYKTLSVAEGEYSRPVLSGERVETLLEALSELETALDYPLDVEWTFRGDELYLLQVRPITTTSESSSKNLWEREDKRPWYRSLTPSFESLSRLREHIEGSVLPGMKAEAEKLEKIPLDRMDDPSLADEIIRRKRIHAHWKEIYWRDLIPFAHGVRLFGRLYNDVIKPENPYEFTRLLSSQGMISLSRNRDLTSLALRIRSSPHIKKSLEEGRIEEIDPALRREMDTFMENYSISVYRGARLFSDIEDLTSLLLNLAQGANHPSAAPAAELEEVFLSSFPREEREEILGILSTARASWRLRDDDNHYLAAIEAALLRSLSLGRERLDVGILDRENSPEEVAALLKGEPLPSTEVLSPAPHSPEDRESPIPRKRRLTGQPASMGVGRGPARVISSPEDLFSFTKGEVLVCDAIDPNMTFVVPLASAIVERRGGMLIHGAIIAREYGIPCVTGVEEAPACISTGDLLVVDGFLGTVSLSEE